MTVGCGVIHKHTKHIKYYIQTAYSVITIEEL